MNDSFLDAWWIFGGFVLGFSFLPLGAGIVDDSFLGLERDWKRFAQDLPRRKKESF